MSEHQDKREQKPCQHCGKLFGRQVYRNGAVQSHAGFERRQFCCRTCSSIVRERGKKQVAERRA
jgi:hypothetical protein